MIEIINKPLLLHLVGYLYYWQMGFNSVFKGLSLIQQTSSVVGKGKTVLLQAWSGPEGSRKLRLTDFMTTAQDGDKVVSLTHRPPLPPGNAPGTHFC